MRECPQEVLEDAVGRDPRRRAPVGAHPVRTAEVGVVREVERDRVAHDRHHAQRHPAVEEQPPRRPLLDRAVAQQAVARDLRLQRPRPEVLGLEEVHLDRRQPLAAVDRRGHRRRGGLGRGVDDDRRRAGEQRLDAPRHAPLAAGEAHAVLHEAERRVGDLERVAEARAERRRDCCVDGRSHRRILAGAENDTAPARDRGGAERRWVSPRQDLLSDPTSRMDQT